MAVNPLDPEEIKQVKKADIQKREISKISLMPPGLLNTLNEEEILDLMMYLASGGKVAMCRTERAASSTVIIATPSCPAARWV